MAEAHHRSAGLSVRRHQAFIGSDCPRVSRRVRISVVINRCGILAGPGQFGTAEQGIFSFWIGSRVTTSPLRFIGFEGSGDQVRDAVHPDDLAALVALQLQRGGIWNVGGGSVNSISVEQLSRWCRERLGPHEVARDTSERQWDAPWLVMDSRCVTGTFDWLPARSLESVLGEIAEFHPRHREWLALSRA